MKVRSLKISNCDSVWRNRYWEKYANFSAGTRKFSCDSYGRIFFLLSKRIPPSTMFVSINFILIKCNLGNKRLIFCDTYQAVKVNAQANFLKLSSQDSQNIPESKFSRSFSFRRPVNVVNSQALKSQEIIFRKSPREH